MTVVYGRHSSCAGGSDGPLPSRTLQAAAVDPVLRQRERIHGGIGWAVTKRFPAAG
ncbi:hypothetical protein CASFOL_010612 [Castilleja foliolosa]|uniref:Uncharacterized protein n=1 Tax=Castilleja foliolosa TaxID=1961234 RepID=A0ABD3DTQ7_9LAMI